MCLKCHEKLSDENVTQQIKDDILNPNFEELNNDKIYSILTAYSGVNGSESQELAGQLIENLIRWSESNIPPANSYTRHDGFITFEAFPCIDDIKKLYLNMKNYPNLKIELSEITRRREAVFHEDFLNQFDP